MCFWFHAARVKFAERLVVLSEQRVTERDEIQFVGGVAQDVQGVREEEETCDVLAQGSKPPKNTPHINASAGTNDNTSDATYLMGALGLSAVLCSNLNEPNLMLLLGCTTVLYKGGDICQGHARLRNDADTLIDMVGGDAARCAQVMHPVVANAFKHSRGVSGWTPDECPDDDAAQHLDFLLVFHPAGWIFHHAAHFFQHACEGCRVV